MTANPTPTMAADATMNILGQLQESFGNVVSATGKRGTEALPSGTPQDRIPKIGRGSLTLGGQGTGAKEVVAAQARNQQGRLQSDGSNSSFPSGSAADSEDSELVHLVARALIRNEDTLNVLRRSTGWVFWVRSGDHSILPMLADLASKWHDTAMKQDTHADHLSLRVTLF